jgi:membrane-associated phospholipid phosphatase
MTHQNHEGWLIAGEVVSFVKDGIPNFMCLPPFGCIAYHIIAKGAEKKMKEMYLQLNLLVLDADAGVSDVNFFVSHARTATYDTRRFNKSIPVVMEENLDQTLSLPFRLAVLALTLLGWLILYFLVNRLQVDRKRRIDLATELDRKTPYVPLFALVYFSTYIFILQPFIILSNVRLFYWMLTDFVSISVIFSLIHATAPSKIERVEAVTAGGLSGWMLGLFQKICKPYGNFPSMHVGLSVPVVAANFIAGGSVIGSIMLVWAVLIALSTLYTKQHYFLDVLAGFVGGLVIFALTFWLMLS